MKYYTVVFDGTPNKKYIYRSEYDLPVGAVCKIQADHTTEYKNNVRIASCISPIEAMAMLPTGVAPRTITKYIILSGFTRPSDRISNVYFNEEKRTTCVIWDDGKKTIVHCQPEDEWDPEKALALCYMKRVLGNRGSFNETLKKWVYGQNK